MNGLRDEWSGSLLFHLNTFHKGNLGVGVGGWGFKSDFSTWTWTNQKFSVTRLSLAPDLHTLHCCPIGDFPVGKKWEWWHYLTMDKLQIFCYKTVTCARGFTWITWLSHLWTFSGKSGSRFWKKKSFIHLFPLYFHVNEHLTKDWPSFKTWI